jgi:hypothetical protein
MAIYVIQSRAECPSRSVWYVQDDRQHFYLGTAGEWHVLPWYFASPEEAWGALRASTHHDAFWRGIVGNG